MAYEQKSNKTLDLVLLVNGIPTATAELKNPLLLCDDDLRQTARALSDIEDFLLQSMKALGKDGVTRDELKGLLQHDISAHVDTLTDSLTSLRRSLMLIAEKVA